MGHGPGSDPIRIVLMPGDDTTMTGRLAEELVVPEAYAALEQLRSRHCEGRMPQNVVKAGRDTPGSQRVKQDLCRIGRFVGMILVEEVMAGMRRIREQGQLLAKRFYLLVVEDANAGQIAMFAVKPHLLRRQVTVAASGSGEQPTNLT